jgi:hypothetical protein
MSVVVMKASGVTQITFSAIALIFVLPGIDALRLGKCQGLYFLLAGGIVIGAIQRYRVSWDDETLSYRGVLRSRSIRFADVSHFEVGGPRRGRRNDPTVGLRIFAEQSSKPAMIINLKPFSREDTARLFERMHQRN